ncbi:MAG TPA: 50S ribosomal protein L13 [Cytophagales bacterium]|nr:50S ribosomal protein L13 [Cytophagales bacterium]HAA23344.1 50S ribosomal protein L13 [Cytophagales bacterium]HAP65014.1 50S ribosomal protein L13 [Cytophagales bacterium]
MDTLSYKTVSANKNTVEKDWIVVDANGKVLGRLISQVAAILRGKHKASFTPHVDCGDNVIVINAEKVRLTGNKLQKKEYIWHTGYPGGQRRRTAIEQMEKDPTRIIENAVRGMLPKNRLGRAIFRNLYVYVGDEHPHAAQQPKELDLKA